MFASYLDNWNGFDDVYFKIEDRTHFPMIWGLGLHVVFGLFLFILELLSKIGVDLMTFTSKLRIILGFPLTGFDLYGSAAIDT